MADQQLDLIIRACRVFCADTGLDGPGAVAVPLATAVGVSTMLVAKHAILVQVIRVVDNPRCFVRGRIVAVQCGQPVAARYWN